MHFVSACCRGEKCRICGVDATHKVEETIFPDEYERGAKVSVIRHPLTAYICCTHYTLVMGLATPCPKTHTDDGLCFCVDCMGSGPVNMVRK